MSFASSSAISNNPTSEHPSWYGSTRKYRVRVNQYWIFSVSTMNRLLLGCLLLIQIVTSQKLDINIGFLFTRNNSYVDYRSSGGAALIAMDRIRTENLLNNVNINFIIEFDDCLESQASGLGTQMITNNNVTAIIGPNCNLPAVSFGTSASFYNIPFFPWGLATSRALEDQDRFWTAATLNAGSYALGVALHQTMRQYRWTDFAFVYSTVGDADKCTVLKEDIEAKNDTKIRMYRQNSIIIQSAINDFNDDIHISFFYQFPDYAISQADTTRYMQALKSRARVFAVCLSDNLGIKRDFALALTDAGMLNDEYVYIFVDPRTRGFVTFEDGVTMDVWVDRYGRKDGRDEEARQAFQRIFILTDLIPEGANYTAFGKEVIKRMADAPFNCTTACSAPQFQTPAVYAGQLHDAVYLYTLALNRTLSSSPQKYRDGNTIMYNAFGVFDGWSGQVNMNVNGTRSPTFYLFALDSNSKTVTQGDVFVDGNTAVFTTYYKSESDLWWNRAGYKRPLSEPICGYKGDNCPLSWDQQYLGIVLGAVAVVIFMGGCLIALGIYFYIAKQKENERADKLWEVSSLSLIKAKSKAGMESMRSIQSGPSTTSTKMTIDSKKDSLHYGFFIYNREIVVASKYASRVTVMEENRVEMRMLRLIEHDNLNRFIGLSMDGAQMMSIWKYCSRGSLQDVIKQGKISLDAFFIYSILRDIINGLNYIHHSPLICHGNLSSECCLVDERWVVKISYYGLHWIRSHEKRRKKDLLWTAPEFLRSEDIFGSKEGDIYSFAIVASEVIAKTSPWDLENRSEKPEEIIYMVKKGGNAPMRPTLTLGENMDINPAMLHLIRDCWSESVRDRPNSDTIKSLLKSMHSGRSDNLMDHVFNMMENYAGSLEEEVEARTRELTEEKKKSDILLYRMLPRQVADKLKLGQSVEPEMYDAVTIFFSDVVKFTNLAAKCTPLQVVNLLNDLYSTFDGIIDEHDAYKVETIGDGYLCVSGLPHRNGHAHVKEICSMALAFMASLKHFKIPHLPGERINLRVGINTGPCVAGVVGLTMPRYCLFGDTVNTASRMESNGKPGHIHLSSDACRLLNLMFPAFRTEPRGEVIIKGKGVMETHWLLDQDADDDFDRAVQDHEARLNKDSPLYRQYQRATTIEMEKVHG
ncbi:gcy-7 [Pristionchus pacificus]|uniref:Guanylate cyclase n=1 Tax=Pristionchus pacificus TaxID=54126 RepID=A0A2A6CLJ0_PRIPA|nr:gcy-7 [Pristionchus pacificus]|eukprot:PDM78986.1 Adenylate and Guanylate cyclase [Pristionchus pacificus]